VITRTRSKKIYNKCSCVKSYGSQSNKEFVIVTDKLHEDIKLFDFTLPRKAKYSRKDLEGTLLRQ